MLTPACHGLSKTMGVLKLMMKKKGLFRSASSTLVFRFWNSQGFRYVIKYLLCTDNVILMMRKQRKELPKSCGVQRKIRLPSLVLYLLKPHLHADTVTYFLLWVHVGMYLLYFS